MSEENVERLRAFCEAWATFDRDKWETGSEMDLSLLDPDVVFEDRVLPDHGGETFHGHEGVIRAAVTWGQAYEHLSIELEQIVGSGDRLVSIHRMRGTGRRSGIDQVDNYAYLWVFQNGRVIRFVSFRDPAEALVAAGLSE